MKLPEQIRRRILANDPEVTKIDLSSSGISDEVIGELVDLLSQNQYIEVLCLFRNNISPEGAKVLSKLTRIRELDLGRNNIGWQGVKCLVENGAIEWLNLAGNAITDRGAKIAAEHSRQLYLSVGMTSVSEEWRKKVAELIEENNEKNLRNHFLPNEGMKRRKINSDQKKGDGPTNFELNKK